jgi:hypothetical protein
VAFFLPPLVPPPRPPELPVAVPPPLAGQTPQTPGPHVRNDAFLSQWIDDLERVLKDAWIKLNSVLKGFDERITILETRVADTYTFGQKGILTVVEDPLDPGAPTILALPLRVVRNEEIVELVVACEKASTADETTLQVQHAVGNADFTAVGLPLTMGPGMKLAERLFTVAPRTPRKILRNDRLRVVIQVASLDAADIVAQVRCR